MPDLEVIATVCHEAIKAFCEANDDYSQTSWEQAEDWQRQSTIASVKFVLKNGNSPAALHENWIKEKLKTGWVYGAIKDVEKKTHPCLVPYEELPEIQQKKDLLFIAIVAALK